MASGDGQRLIRRGQDLLELHRQAIGEICGEPGVRIPKPTLKVPGFTGLLGDRSQGGGDVVQVQSEVKRAGWSEVLGGIEVSSNHSATTDAEVAVRSARVCDEVMSGGAQEVAYLVGGQS